MASADYVEFGGKVVPPPEELSEAAPFSEHDDAGASAQKPGSATPASAVFNLANTIIGASTLAMPYASKNAGVILFAVLLVIVGIPSNFSVRLLVRGMRACGRKSYTDIGVAAYGDKGKQAVIWTVIIQQMGACIAYVVIIADVVQPVLAKVFGDGSILSTREFWQVFLMVLVVFPLTLLKNMDSLRFTSFLALFFIMLFAFSVMVKGGEEMTHGNAGSRGSVVLFNLSADILNALPIACFAYVCHMNVPPIYLELRDRDKNIGKVSMASMAICGCIYFLVGMFGYLTFRSETKGDLLKNYSVSFIEMDVARIGIAITLIFSYPVLAYEMRHCLDEFLFGKRPYDFRRYFKLNVFIVGFSTAVAIAVPQVTIVFSLIGSTTAPNMVFILPPLFFLRLSDDNDPMRKHARWTLWFGAIAMVLSFSMSVYSVSTGGS